MKTDQCCCGRFKELEEPFQINDYRHEPYGKEGNFCGPSYKHDIRDLLSENKELKDLIRYALDIKNRCHQDDYSYDDCWNKMRDILED